MIQPDSFVIGNVGMPPVSRVVGGSFNARWAMDACVGQNWPILTLQLLGAKGRNTLVLVTATTLGGGQGCKAEEGGYLVMAGLGPIVSTNKKGCGCDGCTNQLRRRSLERPWRRTFSWLQGGSGESFCTSGGDSGTLSKLLLIKLHTHPLSGD